MTTRRQLLAWSGAAMSTTVLAACSGNRTPARTVRLSGAVADGRTDDTAAFADAIRRVRETGGVILVPGSAAGYRVGPLRIPTGVRLVGEGADPVTLSPARSLRIWVSTAQDSRGTGLENIDLHGFGLVTGALLQISDGSHDLTVLRCMLRGGTSSPVAGVDVRDRVQRLTIDRSTLTDVQTAVRIAHPADTVQVHGCRFERWTERAIWIRGTAAGAPQNLTIRDNAIGPHAPGGRVRQPIQINGDDRAPIRSVVIAGNRVTGSGTDYADPASPGTADLISLHRCDGFEVTDNVAQDGGEVGITVAQQCRNGTVTGNICRRNGSSGIALGSQQSAFVDTIAVNSNVCQDNGRPGHGDHTPDWARAGIVVERARGITMRDNVCGNSRAGGSQRYGIVIRSSVVDVGPNKLTGNSRTELLRR